MYIIKRILITSCSKKKSKKPGKAKDVYTGPIPAASRRIAEKYSMEWLILSTKYGLISPEKHISPYNKTLYTVHDIEELSHKVLDTFKLVLEKYSDIYLIMGKKYREVIRKCLRYHMKIIKKSRLKVYMLDTGRGIMNMKTNMATVEHDNDWSSFISFKF